MKFKVISQDAIGKQETREVEAAAWHVKDGFAHFYNSRPGVGGSINVTVWATKVERVISVEAKEEPAKK